MGKWYLCLRKKENIIEDLNEDEIPKSVLKMQQNKNKNDNTIENDSRKKKKKDSKKDQKVPLKKKIKKFIILAIVIILIILIVRLVLSMFRWKQLLLDMFNNECSVVVDNNGNIIAELGGERKKIKVDSKDIPDDLKMHMYQLKMKDSINIVVLI